MQGEKDLEGIADDKEDARRSTTTIVHCLSASELKESFASTGLPAKDENIIHPHEKKNLFPNLCKTLNN